MPTPDNPHLGFLQRLRAIVSESDEQRPDQIDEDIARQQDDVLTRLANVLDLEIAETTAEPSGSDFLDQIEDMARQHCFTDKQVRTYHGVPEFNITDSGGTSTDAEALRTLAKHGRFRIVREYGRVVVGYWPENDPNAHALAEERSDDSQQRVVGSLNQKGGGR